MTWKIVRITAAIVLGAGILMNWADVKRYIKIERM
jgi:hypothetical protein